MPVLREGSTSNFINNQYKNDYITFINELECETSNISISLTLAELATGFKLFEFKIIDYSILSRQLAFTIQVCYGICAPSSDICPNS